MPRLEGVAAEVYMAILLPFMVGFQVMLNKLTYGYSIHIAQAGNMVLVPGASGL